MQRVRCVVVEFLFCVWGCGIYLERSFRIDLLCLAFAFVAINFLVLPISHLWFFLNIFSLGTDELLVVSIICGRSNNEMERLKKTYFQMFTQDLGTLLSNETGGNLEFLVMNLLQAAEDEYDERVYNEEKMKDDIETLYKAGQGRFGTKEKEIFKVKNTELIIFCIDWNRRACIAATMRWMMMNMMMIIIYCFVYVCNWLEFCFFIFFSLQILCKSPSEYLLKMNLQYADKHGLTLVKMLETELGGMAQDAALIMLGMKIKPTEEAAKLIHKAVCILDSKWNLCNCILHRKWWHVW